MKHDYFNIDKSDLPFRFEFDSEQETFFMDIDYNESHDFFTATLYDAEMNTLVSGEKLVLNMPLFNDINDDRLPAEQLTPIDESGTEQRITWDNFNEKVFLCIDDLPSDSGDGPEEAEDDSDSVDEAAKAQGQALSALAAPDSLTASNISENAMDLSWE